MPAVVIAKPAGQPGRSSVIAGSAGPLGRLSSLSAIAVAGLVTSVQYRLGGEVKLDVGRYYRLKAADFYPIHSLFLIHPRGEPSPILLMFWIAWNETEQTVNEGSLQRICGLECPPDTRRRYVVVTPSGAQPRMRVPRTIFSHRGQEDTVPIKVFPAFHFEISMGTYSDMYYK